MRLAPVVVIMAAVALGSACAKPATVEFEPNKPVVIKTDKGVPVPNVVVKDDEGNVLEGKKPTLSLEGDTVTLDEALGKLNPVKNGQTKLIATIEGVPPASVAVKVQIIDDLKVTCAEPCSVRIGETMKLDIEATGMGTSLVNEIEWTSSDDKVGVFADGGLKGVAPGDVTLTAKLGGKTATVKATVRPAVDEVRLVCPWPPLLAITKSAGEPFKVPKDVACDLVEGDEVTYPVMLRAAGKPVTGERIEWTSSDNSVVVGRGMVRADHAGGAVVEARVGGLAVEMPTSVYARGKKAPPMQCSGQEERYTTGVQTGGQLQSASGAAPLPLNYSCESVASKKCIDEGIAALRKAISTLPLNDDDVAEFGRLIADDRARRCCCKK